jgi:hypothetical protein|tara:strand:+ start:301 stop:477 length:177 start_codon:yes stop_codon:yes gene_type:complete
MVLEKLDVILAVIIGTLAAIVYSLRVLVLMDRKIARIEMHIESVVAKGARKASKGKKK